MNVRRIVESALSVCALSALLAPAQDASTFQKAVDLVNQHSRLEVLKSADGKSAIAVWPQMQGRVLTSTAEGMQGRDYGWVNTALIESGKVQPHINNVGGEDRLWLGPEGGQFSLFFAKGAPFDLEHWYTPAPIDTEAFDVVSKTANSIKLRKTAQIGNYSGTQFKLRIDREVRLLTDSQAWEYLHVRPMHSVKVVAFESDNALTNESDRKWTRESGLLSIWILGQFQSAPQSAIVLPLAPAQDGSPGVKTDYFGPVPPERIQISPNAVLFKADANYRSKLGVSPQRSRAVVGAYDPQNSVLTIVQFTQPKGLTDYVNSAWEIQNQPFRGDVANCYNDGPPAPGKPQLGKFFELESSSPAEALAPGQSVRHVQRTIHLVGPESELDRVARTVLGVSLRDVQQFTGSNH